MEVVFDDAYPAGDLAVFPRQIPLRDGVSALQAGVDALPVIFCGYTPFLMEPLGGLRGQLRVQTQGKDLHIRSPFYNRSVLDGPGQVQHRAIGIKDQAFHTVGQKQPLLLGEQGQDQPFG